ncbi:MAG: shikimate dehydrogenase [Verrucomicrobia bacterium]|nr:shikimate dehydrogenase [Verrucomicrobiota bacterium]
MEFVKAEKPTIYFIGVTTGKSSIMKVFPAWAKYLKLGDVAIKGFDLKLHDEPARYREVVDFIKRDPLSLGALVTTHKIDLLKACRDQFDDLDEFADMMGEVSSISKRGTRLVGHAKDPITSGLALEAFLPANHWKKTGAEAFVLGAGGSAIAITWYMMTRKERPSKIIVANRSTPRLDEMRHVHQRLEAASLVEYVHTPSPVMSDDIMERLKPGSLVINATGLGKDAPGSPLTNGALFPQDGIVWEFNYRGDLLFLQQARAQQQTRHLQIEDGWVYFLHGWTRVVAEVFHVEIPTSGPVFEEISRIAKEAK